MSDLFVLAIVISSGLAGAMFHMLWSDKKQRRIEEQKLKELAEWKPLKKSPSAYYNDKGIKYNVSTIEEQVVEGKEKLFTFKLEDGSTVKVLTNLEVIFDKRVGARFIELYDSARVFTNQAGVEHHITMSDAEIYYGAGAEIMFILENGKEVRLSVNQ